MPLMPLSRFVIPAAALAAVVTAALPAWSQSATELKYSLGLLAEAETNPKLLTTGDASSNSLALQFGLDLVSETAISRLAFTAHGLVLSENGAGARKDGLTDPLVSLSYDRAVADADLNLSLRHVRTDLDRAAPGDVDEGAGERQVNRASAAVNWGKSGPLGFGLSTTLEDTTYVDAPASVDRRTERLGATVRADLSKVFQTTFGVSTYRYRPDTGRQRDTNSADLGFYLTRPSGSLNANLGIEDTEDGRRETLRLGQYAEFPSSRLTWGLGVTRGVTGKTSMTGEVNWQHEMAHGNLGVTLSRAVTSNDTTDEESLQNRAGLNWRQSITEHGALRLGASWAEITNRVTDVTTTSSQITAAWSHDLPQDWELDAGYSRRFRDSDTKGSSDSDRVFLELRREFRTRF